MTDDTSDIAALFAASAADSPERKVQLAHRADKLRLQMEEIGGRIKQLVLSLPPVELIGYLYSQFTLQNLAEASEGEPSAEGKRKVAPFNGSILWAMEYVHAVLASFPPIEEEVSFDEAKAVELLSLTERLQTINGLYAMVSSRAAPTPYLTELEFKTKIAWFLLRGHRYQVLEQEFFEFVLSPHSNALLTAYGMSASQIAAEVQRVANAMRTGVADAMARIGADVEHVLGDVASDHQSRQKAMHAFQTENPRDLLKQN